MSSVAAATAAALPAWLWMCVNASLGHSSSGGVAGGLAEEKVWCSNGAMSPGEICTGTASWQHTIGRVPLGSDQQPFNVGLAHAN